MTKHFLVAFALVGAACGADHQSEVRIRGRAVASESCEYTGGGQVLMGGGTLDVGPAYAAIPKGLEYRLVVYVKNSLVDPTTVSDTATVAAKTWSARTARVRVRSDVLGGERIVRYDVPSYDVAPGEELPQDAVLIGRALGEELATKIPAGQSQRAWLGVTIEGQTGDTFNLDTNEWPFLLEVCNGCLPPPTTCPAGQVVTLPACLGPGQDSPPTCAAPVP